VATSIIWEPQPVYPVPQCAWACPLPSQAVTHGRSYKSSDIHRQRLTSTLPRARYGQSRWQGRRRGHRNLAADRYKLQVAERPLEEDPAQLIRKVLALEREIMAGLERLLRKIEA
jgi:hypothetical protein